MDGRGRREGAGFHAAQRHLGTKRSRSRRRGGREQWFVLLPWQLVERVHGPGVQVQQEISSFEEKGARVLAMSVDSP